MRPCFGFSNNLLIRSEHKHTHLRTVHDVKGNSCSEGCSGETWTCDQESSIQVQASDSSHGGISTPVYRASSVKDEMHSFAASNNQFTAWGCLLDYCSAGLDRRESRTSGAYNCWNLLCRYPHQPSFMWPTMKAGSKRHQLEPFRHR